MHINDLLKIAVERKALRSSPESRHLPGHPHRRLAGPAGGHATARCRKTRSRWRSRSCRPGRRRSSRTTSEIDIAYNVPSLGRFRCNIFQQRGTVGLVLRVIPDADPVDRGPAACRPCSKKICRGAARPRARAPARPAAARARRSRRMIDHINATRNAHVMTVEDPIEFLHRDKKSIVNQREVDVDTTVVRAWRCAARCARTRTSSSSAKCATTRRSRPALLAAETGHLVFSTLHTLDATETINRIIAVFPPHQQKQVRLQLGAVLKAVISQRLMPRADGLGRVPAVEVLIRTTYIRDCIVEQGEDAATSRTPSQQGTSQYGMQTFDQSIFSLYKSGLVTLEEALQALDQRRTSSSCGSRASSPRPTSRGRRWTRRSRRPRISTRSRRSRPSTSPTSLRGAARRSAEPGPPRGPSPRKRHSSGPCACSASGRAAATSCRPVSRTEASRPSRSPARSSGSNGRAFSTTSRRRDRACGSALATAPRGSRGSCGRGASRRRPSRPPSKPKEEPSGKSRRCGARSRGSGRRGRGSSPGFAAGGCSTP